MPVPRTLLRATTAAVCLFVPVALMSCGSSRKIVAPPPAIAAPDTTQTRTEIERLDPDESLRYARERIDRARDAQSSGQGDLAQAEVDLASDILATIEIDQERQPREFKRFVELLRLLEQTRREVTAGRQAAPSEVAPALALIQSLDPKSLEALTVDDVQQVMTIQKIAETCEVPMDCTPPVLRNIRFFTTTARKSMAAWLARSATYSPMILGVLEEEGLPRDLANLPMIESGYNPFAISRAQAVGMWQFIAETGRIFGLRNDDWVDERRDPEKSTRAAARYLKNLHERLGDWRLALASYNWGRLNVERAMDREKTRNFWELRVPRETQNYVPLFMAVAIIARSPETFGFRDVSPGAPWNYDPVPLSAPVHLKIAADCAGTTLEALRGLNPDLKWGVTPPSERYVLRLPPGTGERFRKAFAELPPERRSVWHGYKVKRGETLAVIAARYGISPEVLARANGMKPGKKLKRGKSILVPLYLDRGATEVAAKTDPVPKSEPASSPSQIKPAGSAPDSPSAKPTRYRVRRGDTLRKVARSFGVTVKQLCAWNRLSPRARLRPGGILLLWPEGRAEERESVGKASDAGTRRLRVHTVRAGDTLYRISRKYEVSVADILDWNRLRDPDVHPGDRLKVYTMK